MVLTTAEIYDPTAGTWSPAGNLSTARWAHTATMLPSGKVMLVGGLNDPGENVVLASTDLYDPAAGTWSPAASLSTARWAHAAVLLPNGVLMVSGGATVNGPTLQSVELYW